MNTPIADTAVYQQTVLLMEKYKAQRDLLLVAIKKIRVPNGISMVNLKDVDEALAKVEQSL